MTRRMTKAAYEALLAEDIAWLELMPRTLERDHILLILRESTGLYYPAGEAWRSVKDDPPEVGTNVIVWAIAPGADGCPSMQCWGSHLAEVSASIGIEYTHWMPLPSAPEEG